MLRVCTSVFECNWVKKSSKNLLDAHLLRAKNSKTGIRQILRSSKLQALTCSQWTSFYGNTADKLVYSSELCCLV